MELMATTAASDLLSFLAGNAQKLDPELFLSLLLEEQGEVELLEGPEVSLEQELTLSDEEIFMSLSAEDEEADQLTVATALLALLNLPQDFEAGELELQGPEEPTIRGPGLGERAGRELLESLKEKSELLSLKVRSELGAILEGLEKLESQMRELDPEAPQVFEARGEVQEAAARALNALFQEPQVEKEEPLFFALYPEKPKVQAVVKGAVPQELIATAMEPNEESELKPPVQPPKFETGEQLATEMLPHAILPQLEAQGFSQEDLGKRQEGKPGEIQEIVFAQVFKANEELEQIELPEPLGQVPFEEVISRATVKVGEEIQELAVQIRPQSLGKVLMRVAMEDGHLVAKFLTENTQAKGILELNLPQLRETLAQEGLVLERCQVALGFGQDFGQRKEEQPRPRYRNPKQALDYEEHLPVEFPKLGLVNFIA